MQHQATSAGFGPPWAPTPDPSWGRPIGWDPTDPGSPDPFGRAPATRTLQPPLFAIGGPAAFPSDDGRVDRAAGAAVGVHPDRIREAATSIIEVLIGRRPVAQLVSWVDPVVLAVVETSRRRLEETLQGRAVPPIRIAGVRAELLTPATIEAAVRVVVAERSIAMAFQLRRHGRRWTCSAWEHRPADLLGLPQRVRGRPPRRVR